MASTLTAKGRGPDALDVWESLEKASPKDAEAPRTIARILAQEMKYPEAIAELQAAEERDPDDTSLAVATLGHHMGSCAIRTRPAEA